jgi:hypothetical protein
MFGMLSANLRIGKAMIVANSELGIDLAALTGSGTARGLTDPAAMEWREMTRTMIREVDPNAKELALMMCYPFVPHASVAARAHLRERTLFWKNLGVVRAEIADEFLEQLT